MLARTRRPGLLGALQAPAVALVALLGVGTAGFVLIEGWTVLDAAFMSVITLTTIGYGETHPLSPEGRLFTIVYIFGGLGVTTLALTGLARYIADGGLARDVAARREAREMRSMHDHFIVVGFGRLGRAIAEDLRHLEGNVVVVEIDAAERTDEEGFHFVHGDATRDEVLLAAGIDRAKGIAIATPSDATNVYITLAARQLNPNVHIQTRVEDAAAVPRARRAGADGVVRPFHLGGLRMAQALARPGFSAFLEQASERGNEGLHLAEVLVQDGSGLVGRLADLALPARYGISVVGLQPRGQSGIQTPKGDTEVAVGDRLVVFGPPEQIRTFADAHGPPVAGPR